MTAGARRRAFVSSTITRWTGDENVDIATSRLSTGKNLSELRRDVVVAGENRSSPPVASHDLNE